MIEKELANRPKYFKKWAEAKEKHMGPFFLEFHSRVQKEQKIKEHIDKPSKEVIDIRKKMRYILNMDNITKDDFFE